MKNFVFFVLLNIMFFNTDFAYSVPCITNNCYEQNNVPWTEITEVIPLNLIPACPSCSVSITYRYRFSTLCPGQQTEFQVIQVFCIPGCLGLCPNFSPVN